MATWLASIVKRLPLRTYPSAAQIDIAKEFTGQPETEGVFLTYMTVRTLVWAQAMEAQCAVDDRVAQELMAALTWDRTIVAPDPQRILDAQRQTQLPPGALRALAQIRRQTNYLLIEQPALGDSDAFINGAWLMRDVDHETGQLQLLVLLDLVVRGQPVRDVRIQFTLQDTFEAAVEHEIETIAAVQQWDAVPHAMQRRDNMRTHMMGMLPILAAFHDTFVEQTVPLELARAAARPDELGFTYLDLANATRGSNQLAAGLLH